MSGSKPNNGVGQAARRLLAAFLAVLLLTAVPAAATQSAGGKEGAPSGTEELLSHVGGISLYCVEAGLYLYGKNENVSTRTYSLSRLVNVMVACDLVKDPDEGFEIEEDMLSKSAKGYGLKAGERVTYRDLMVMILYRGFDDASTVLARKLGGEETYIRLMNEKAKALGAASTLFTDVTGRSEDSLTTPADIALIAAGATGVRLLASIARGGRMECPSIGKTLYNRNYMLSNYYNATGVAYLSKNATGLVAAGPNDEKILISSMEIGNYTYVCAVTDVEQASMGAYEYDAALKLTEALAGRFSRVTVLSRNDFVCEVPVNMGDGHDAVALSPADDFVFFLPDGVNPDDEFSYTYELASERLEAPVALGTVVGKLTLKRRGEVVGETDLLTRADVGRSMTEYYQNRFLKMLTSKTALHVIIAVLIVAVIYIIIMAIWLGQKAKRIRKANASGAGSNKNRSRE